MSALHSAQHLDVSPRSVRSVAAIVYADESYPDQIFKEIVRRCRSRGLSLAGVLQHRAAEEVDRKCDVVLENLATRHCISLFESRGKGATGCRLDTSALARVAVEIEKSLDDSPDLLVLNKFGKEEASGEGLLDLIAQSLDLDIPVMIGVPARNLDEWRDFAGAFSVEFAADADGISQWVDGVTAGPNIDATKQREI